MIVIIGAGPAGLSIAYHLKRWGHKFLILERDHVGYTWVNQYKSLKLNTHRDDSSLPGLQMPSSYPIYPSGEQFAQYLKKYVQYFQLPVVSKTNVNNIHFKNTKWLINTKNGECFSAGKLVIATGTWATPIVPKIRGENSFSGQIQHASTYKEPSRFQGKNVLVVGSGSSASDITLNLIDHARFIGISIRNGVNITPRTSSKLLIRTMAFLMSNNMTYQLVRLIVNIFRPDYSYIGLPLHPYAYDEIGYHPIVGTELVNAVRLQLVKPYPEIECIFRDRVKFVNGQDIQVDHIILATGYRPAIDFTEPHVLVGSNGYPILDGIRSTLAPNLFFVGMSYEYHLRRPWLPSIKKSSLIGARQIVAGG